MLEPILILRSSIRPALMRQAVIRGSCLSGAGGLLLLITGAILPAHLLKLWGLPIFLIGIALITWGLYPYRRLKNLENNPHRIIIDQKEWLHFLSKGKPIFSTPLKNISQIKYIEKKHTYGIGVILNQEKQPTIKTKISCIEESDCDFFLPYFSKQAFLELNEHLNIQFDHNPD